MNMLRLGQEKAAWELKNEANKINVRWFLIVIIFAYLAYLLKTGQAREIGNIKIFNWYYITAVAVGLSLFNLLCMIYLIMANRGKLTVSPVMKYTTMIVDFIVISLVLIPTGGNESMFFVVYFIVIVSNGLRYGMRLSIAGVLIFNICYVSILIFQFYPNLAVKGLQQEILKVAGFWLIGLYVGFLSRKFEFLQGEVEKYQRLIQQLMARKGDL